MANSDEIFSGVKIIEIGLISFPNKDCMPGVVVKGSTKLGIKEHQLYISNGSEEPCLFQKAIAEGLVPPDVLEETYKAIPTIVNISREEGNMSCELALLIDKMLIEMKAMIKEQTEQTQG